MVRCLYRRRQLIIDIQYFMNAQYPRAHQGPGVIFSSYSLIASGHLAIRLPDAFSYLVKLYLPAQLRPSARAPLALSLFYIIKMYIASLTALMISTSG